MPEACRQGLCTAIHLASRQPARDCKFEILSLAWPHKICRAPRNCERTTSEKTPPSQAFCQSLLLALDIVELRYPHGVVITTSGITKFYSNGLDLEHANWTPGFFGDSLYALWRRLLTYPMPTIALMNGHAFAGALMTAMMHDYRIMNPHRGYLCLNEVELGVPLRPPMSSIFRQKVSPQTYRTLVLEGKRFKVRFRFLDVARDILRVLTETQALDALKENIIDGVGGLDEALTYTREMRLVSKPDKGVYGALKREMWRETVSFLENWDEESGKEIRAELARQRESKDREAKVKSWEANKAKL